MKNLFTVSSPLQYLFASLVANCKHGEDDNLAVFYTFQRDFREVYEQIDRLTGFSLTRIPHESGVDLDGLQRLFIGNRFNATEIDYYWRLHRRVEAVNLFEEGANLYLKAFYRDPNRRDDYLKLAIKNQVLRCFGRPPVHLALGRFGRVYSVFPDIPLLPAETEQVSLLDQLRGLAGDDTAGAGRCVVLSQWLVKYGMLSSDEYIGFMTDLGAELRASHEAVHYKPHPRDEPAITEAVMKAMGASALPAEYQDTPVELFLAQHPRCDVYGFWTSAMFYARRAFGTRCFTLFPALLDRFPDGAELARQYDSVRELMKRHDISTHESSRHVAAG